ncbi:thioesterase [Candidatus Poribacteria bacterium]|jgi:acyl-CoA thioester hydrolase|nr:thioesterase [Candidatus Poribacteria bacterium]
MKTYLFKIDFLVRDYECDLQGIVNNSVYQNYLEHARHQFLKTVGLDFSLLFQQGITLVVTRAELDYRWPLKSGDQFWIGLNIHQTSKIRYQFHQDIYNRNDQRLILSSIFTATSLNDRGRPQSFPQIQEALTCTSSPDQSESH